MYIIRSLMTRSLFFFFCTGYGLKDVYTWRYHTRIRETNKRNSAMRGGKHEKRKTPQLK